MNRVAKIQQHKDIQWRFVLTSGNPADIASRGGQISSCTLWARGPVWLQSKQEWPKDVVTKSSTETESKTEREIFNTMMSRPDADDFNNLLERCNSLHRMSRVGVWIKRFINNCRSPTKHLGPITTEEVSHIRDWWIRQVQERERQEPHYSKMKDQLDLQPNTNNLELCHGRIQEKHPVYLLNKAKFMEMLVQQVHREVLHGGVGLTMAAVRER